MMLASITEEGIVVKEPIRKNPFAAGVGWLARTAEAALSRLQESRQRRREARAEAAWRRDFRPHAVILTERDRPVMLAAMMFTGDQRFVFFEKGADPATLGEQTRQALPDEVPLFGEPQGYIVSDSPDHAVRYDLDGKKIEEYPQAFRPTTGKMEFREGWFDFRKGQPGYAPGEESEYAPLELRKRRGPAVSPRRPRGRPASEPPAGGDPKPGGGEA